MAHQSKKPNIVVFVAEDLDFEGLNCYNATETGYSGLKKAGNEYAAGQYGVSKLLTPTIDALARDGVLFNNFEPDQLYDLHADLLEQNNVADTPARQEKLQEMKEMLKEELSKLPHVFGEFTTPQPS